MDDDHPADIGRPRRQGDRITPLFVAAAYDGYGTYGPANLAQSCPLSRADWKSFEPSEHFR